MSKILIVDDELSMLKGIQLFLSENKQYDIFSASEKEIALDILESSEIDLVVSDLMLPEIGDGLEVIDHAARHWNRPAVLVMTAFESVDNAVKAMKAGADDFISKRFGLDEISLRIQNLLKKKEKIKLLSIENTILKDTIRKHFSDYKIVGKSPQIVELLGKVKKVASDAKVSCLIQGESGTGKDLIARTLHQLSRRRNAPFIPVNCAAIPENLIESELFGHEKGAFTGAYTSQQGKFEQAKHGIIFLDEIGELPLNLQVRLLRVLEERSFYRIGGNKQIDVDVMIISATNRNIQQLVRENKFREDLYYRLNVINLFIPPLRERREDIPVLAEFFLEKFNLEKKKNLSFTKKTIQLLESYDFPGNVRELRNLIEDAFVFCEGPLIRPQNLSLNKIIRPRRSYTKPVSNISQNLNQTDSFPPHREALQEFEREYFLKLLQNNYWNINDASIQANISREWLGKKIKLLNLKKQ
jgi:two-component system response regulator AtoC